MPHNVLGSNSRHISAAIASPNFDRPDKGLDIPPSASSTAADASPSTCRRWRTGSLAAAPAAGAAAAHRHRTLRGANAWMERRHIKKSGTGRERRSTAHPYNGRRPVPRPDRMLCFGIERVRPEPDRSGGIVGRKANFPPACFRLDVGDSGDSGAEVGKAISARHRAAQLERSKYANSVP